MSDKYNKRNYKWLLVLMLFIIFSIYSYSNNVFTSNTNESATIDVDRKSSVYRKGRIALIIANSKYENLSQLKNPYSDAEAVAKRLKNLGFSFIHPIQKSDVQYDLTQIQLLTARNELSVASEGKQIAFIYYSGHGASLGKRSEAHILPVDVDQPTKNRASLEVLESRSLSLEKLLGDLDQKAELVLAVFDACREIPQIATKGIFDNDLWKGLARVSGSAGHNRIIAYSGSQGQVVADGDGEYSPYTKVLLNVLDNNPDLEIGNFFRKVAMLTKSHTHQTAEVLIQGVPLDTYSLKPKVDIHKLQQKLKDRRYYYGEINGVYDSATEDAFQRFMQDQK